MEHDEFTRIIQSFEKQAQDASRAAHDAHLIAADAERKYRQAADQRNILDSELRQALDLLATAGSRVAEVIEQEAHATDTARFERRTALLDAARIARGVQL